MMKNENNVIDMENKKEKIIKPIDARYKTYGCELDNKCIPISVLKYPKMLGLKNVLVVPRRKRGLTSSGNPNECHSNADRLSHLYGGASVRGYKLGWGEDKTFIGFSFHSLWRTPEGRLVEITEDNDSLKDKDCWGDGYVRFMPYEEIKMTNLDEEPKEIYEHIMRNLMVEIGRTSKVQILPDGRDVSGGTVVEIHKKGFRKVVKENLIITNDTPYKRYWKINSNEEPILFTAWSLPDAVDMEMYGGFSKPSLFTGRTFDETVMRIQEGKKEVRL
jgi:hypothetical protein